MAEGRSFDEFPEVIMRVPTYLIGLTFLVTRQCGEDFEGGQGLLAFFYSPV